MRKVWVAIVSVLVLSGALWAAGTRTTNFQMYKPEEGETGWAGNVNSNFDTVDSRLTDLAYNVRAARFGATGDGVADDGAEIQAAIDAVHAAGGGIVYLPPGTYLFATGLTFPASSSLDAVHLVGAGNASLASSNEAAPTKLLYTGSGSAITIDDHNNGSIRDLLLKCNHASGCVGLDLLDATNEIVVERVALKGVSGQGTAIQLSGQTSCICHNSFRDVTIHTWATGLRLSGFANANLFERVRFVTLTTGIDISAAGSDTVGGDNNVFIRCGMSGTQTTGINIDDTSPSNLFLTVVQDGTFTTGLAIGTASTGNTFINSTLAGTVSLAGTAIPSTIGIGTSGLDGRLRLRVATAETITAGATITADACGTIKPITAAGAVTTSTTNTFTGPESSNDGCIMDVCNTGSQNITLDANANFISAGAADVVLTGDDCVRVGSDGTDWRQLAPIVAN